MVVCEQHPCKCVQCKHGEVCSWRVKAKKYLADHGLLEAAADGRVTYVQALELMGLLGPKSPRQRNMLNVFARLPDADPLQSTLMIMDISQAIDQAILRCDGSVPTMGVKASMWSMRAGRLLDVCEMAKMMGLDTREVDLRSTTECQMREMLGTSIHVTTAGVALIGLLAAAGSRNDRRQGLR